MKILSAFTHPHAIPHVFLFHAITINGRIPNFKKENNCSLMACVQLEKEIKVSKLNNLILGEWTPPSK